MEDNFQIPVLSFGTQEQPSMGSPFSPQQDNQDAYKYIGTLESNFDPTAGNKASSAYGIGQFLSGTRGNILSRGTILNQDGKPATDADYKSDPEVQKQVLQQHISDNTAILQKNNIPVTNQSLYAMHHFDPKSAITFNTAANDVVMDNILPQNAIAANPYLKGKTKAEVLANWDTRYLGTSSKPKTDYQIPVLGSTQTSATNPIMFNVNGKQLPGYVYDGDTVIIDDGTSKGIHVRIPGIDTGETTKMMGDVFKAGSYTGGAQAKTTDDVIRNLGYTNIKIDPKSKDVNDRFLADFTDKTGNRISTTLVGQKLAGVYDPKAAQDQVFARQQFSLFEAMHGYRTTTPVIQQAKDTYDYLMNLPKVQEQITPDTNEELLAHKTWTSEEGLRVLNNKFQMLDKEVSAGNLSGDALIQKQKDRDDAYQALMFWSNRPKNEFNWYSKEGPVAERSWYGQLHDSFDKGMWGVSNTYGDFLRYTGDVTGDKGLEAKGKEVGFKAQFQLDQLEKKSKTIHLMDVVDKPTKSLQYTANTIAQFGPQLATMWGGSAGLGWVGKIMGGIAGGTLGTLAGPEGTIAGAYWGSNVGQAVGSSIVPIMMGVADWYGEQPESEKDALIATIGGATIGLIDRYALDVKGLTGRELFTEKGRQLMAEKIMESQAAKGIKLTEPEARKLLNQDIVDFGKQFHQEMSMIAKEELIARNALKDTVWYMTQAMGKEGVTEAIQEAIQGVGMNMTTSANYSTRELLTRIAEAGVAGGIVGAALHGPAGYAQSKNARWQTDDLTGQAVQSKISKLRDLVMARNDGKEVSDIDIAKEGKLIKAEGPSLLEDGNDGKVPFSKALMKLATNPFGDARDSFLKKFAHVDEILKIGGLLDAGFARGVFSGLSAPKRIALINNSSLAHMTPLSDLITANNVNNMDQVSNIFFSGRDTAGTHAVRTSLNNVADALIEQNNNMGGATNTGYDDNQIRSLVTGLRVIDPAADPLLLAKELTKLPLKTGFGQTLSQSAVDDLVHKINTGYGADAILEMEQLGILTDPRFDKFLRKDIQNNLNDIVSNLAGRMTSNAMFGRNGEVLNNFVNKAKSGGKINDEQAKEIKTYLANYYNAINNKYQKWDNPSVQAVQTNAVFLQTMMSMDTSLFSQFADIGFGMFGLSGQEQIKYVGRFGIDFGMQIAGDIRNLAAAITKGKLVKEKSSADMPGGGRLKEGHLSGHIGPNDDITVRSGLVSGNSIHHSMYKAMFKINGVEQLSNAARSARLSFAGDKINELMTMYMMSPNSTAGMYAADRLANYRIPVKEASEIWKRVEIAKGEPSPEDAKRIKEMMEIGFIHFVDEFSVRPEVGSGPFIFDDGRYQLFTQFQRFMANVTSKVVPQLWNFYIKRGSPQMTYSAFTATIVSMALGYAGFALKQALGGTDDDDKKKDAEYYLAKAWDKAGFTGLASKYSDIALGAADIATDIGQDNVLSKIFGGSHSKDVYKPTDLASAASSAGKFGLSTMPAINTAVNIGKDVYGVSTDGDDKAKERLYKRIPFLGDFGPFREAVK